MTGQRVEHVGYPGRQGEIWVPKFANAHVDFWHAAKALGLTADPEPDETREWHMVEWDNRVGVLEVRYLEELTFLPPEPEPTPPTEREKLITEVEHAMWHALHTAEDDKGMGAYVNAEDGMIDATGAGISLRPAAEAALKVFAEDLAKTAARVIDGLSG